MLQPIIDIATGRIAGHEALTRFDGTANDPRGVFRLAHIDGYGDLLEAATIIAALAVPDRPVGQALYVNASARALTSSRFWARMPARLDTVVVELTEDLEHVDGATLADAVARLRSRGASVALDDLGAGVGEFYRMAALRPDVVKADRSLVHGCASEAGQSAVLQGLVAYARALGAQVCAEGVEDIADLDHLGELGVSLAQGFLLGRPDPNWRVGKSQAAPSDPSVNSGEEPVSTT